MTVLADQDMEAERGLMTAEVVAGDCAAVDGRDGSRNGKSSNRLLRRLRTWSRGRRAREEGIVESELKERSSSMIEVSSLNLESSVDMQLWCRITLDRAGRASSSSGKVEIML